MTLILKHNDQSTTVIANVLSFSGSQKYLTCVYGFNAVDAELTRIPITEIQSFNIDSIPEEEITPEEAPMLMVAGAPVSMV